ncbi:MAG: hypothetical protein HC933_11280, partial [Pleurocapsa sp. SU_196_0]|nr:hypothetical protein [Pleurocapsa sp. SU_196_0]
MSPTPSIMSRGCWWRCRAGGIRWRCCTRSMSAVSARVAVIPGRNAIGIELPNVRRETVHLRELLESETYQRSASKLSMALGKGIHGDPIVGDLATMPHLLIAGSTG